MIEQEIPIVCFIIFAAVFEQIGTKPVKDPAVTIRKAFVTTCTLAAPVERLFELH